MCIAMGETGGPIRQPREDKSFDSNRASAGDTTVELKDTDIKPSVSDNDFVDVGTDQ